MSKSLFRFWTPIFLVISGLFSTALHAAPNPSFPCSKRMSPDEKAICLDKRLTTLDRIANQGYLFLRAKLGKAQANNINLPLIRQRQKCKTDVVCIEKAQRESIRVFNLNGARLEIPEAVTDSAAVGEPPVAEANQPAISPEPAPSGEAATSSETAQTSDAPASTPGKPGPDDAPVQSTETTTLLDKAPVTADETAATSTPAPPPAATTTPAAESKDAEKKDAEIKSETAGVPQEPIDQPPLESEGTAAATDSASAPDDASKAVAGATPEPSGSREWRPEIEKEIRAESELEASATDALSQEIDEAEQIKPLSRHDREVLQSTRSKHRTAFILSAILFALVVAYAFSKFRRDPGMSVTTAKPATPPVHTGVTINRSAAAPTTPSPAPPVAPAINVGGTAVTGPAANTRPTIASTSVQPPPEAWVWSQYRDKI